MIIAFEGVDGAGKSTQCSMLAQRLRSDGIDCETHSFPSNHMYLMLEVEKDPIMLHGALADDRRNCMKDIKLDKVHIIDRWKHSNIAYGLFNGLDMKQLSEMEDGIPDPDRVVFLDTDIQEAAVRSGERQDKLKKIREKYETIMDGWIRVSGDGSIYDVHDRIYHYCRDYISKNG